MGTKRTIENVPTSPIEGVAYGLAEITGTAELDPAQPVLEGPLNQRECVYYRYIVHKKGSDDKWKTVRDESQSTSFFCHNGQSRTFIDRTGARFIPKERRTRRSGNKKYIEEHIFAGEPLYILGSAEIDPETHDKLLLGQGSRAAGYIAPNEDTLRAEQHVRDEVVAIVEAHPELAGHKLVDELSKQLVRVEDEIVLVRDGYNDSVERFNTRLQKLPELFIAKLFGFKRASHFRIFNDEESGR